MFALTSSSSQQIFDWINFKLPLRKRQLIFQVDSSHFERHIHLSLILPNALWKLGLSDVKLTVSIFCSQYVTTTLHAYPSRMTPRILLQRRDSFLFGIFPPSIFIFTIQLMVSMP